MNPRLLVAALALLALVALVHSADVDGVDPKHLEYFERSAAAKAFFLSEPSEEAGLAFLQAFLMLHNAPSNWEGKYSEDDAQALRQVDHSVSSLLAAAVYRAIPGDFVMLERLLLREALETCNPQGTNRPLVVDALLNNFRRANLEDHLDEAFDIIMDMYEDNPGQSHAGAAMQSLVRSLYFLRLYDAVDEGVRRCSAFPAASVPMCGYVAAMAAMARGEPTDEVLDLFAKVEASIVESWTNGEQACTYIPLSIQKDFSFIAEDPVLSQILTVREEVGSSKWAGSGTCSTQEFPHSMVQNADGSFTVEEGTDEAQRMRCTADYRSAVSYNFTNVTAINSFVVHEETCTVFSFGMQLTVPVFPPPTYLDLMGRGAYRPKNVETALLTNPLSGNTRTAVLEALAQVLFATDDRDILKRDGKVRSPSDVQLLVRNSRVLYDLSMAGVVPQAWLTAMNEQQLVKAEELIYLDWTFTNPNDPFGTAGTLVDGTALTPSAVSMVDMEMPPLQFMEMGRSLVGGSVRAKATASRPNVVYLRHAMAAESDEAFMGELKEIVEGFGMNLWVVDEAFEFVVEPEEPEVYSSVHSLAVAELDAEKKAAKEAAAAESGEEEEEEKEVVMTPTKKLAGAISEAAIVIGPDSEMMGFANAIVDGSSLVQFGLASPRVTITSRQAASFGADFWVLPSIVLDDQDPERNQLGDFSAALSTVEHILLKQGWRNVCGEEPRYTVHE